MENILQNSETRDKELKEKCENHRKFVYELIQSVEKNDLTIKAIIQQWALDLEELFILHGQQWIIDTIASEIIASLKVVGITGRRLTYVYDALANYPKYFKKKDHTIVDLGTGAGSFQTVTNIPQRTNHIEHLYRNRAEIIRYHLQQAEQLFDPAYLERNESRDLTEYSVDIKEKWYAMLEMHKIPLVEKKQDDFHGTEDKFKEKIPYPETKPAFTLLTEAWERNIEARQKVLKRLIAEGRESLEGIVLLTDDMIKGMAEAIDLDTHIWQPFTDRKFRKNNLQWIQIIENSISWFKHSASKKFKTPDLQGNCRELTREAIGAKKPEILKMAEKVVKLEPMRWLMMGIWWVNTADKRGSEFSQKLSPKLADRSIK